MQHAVARLYFPGTQDSVGLLYTYYTVAPKRVLKWHWSGAKVAGRAPPFFGFKSTISRFGERFRDGQHSLVSFLFAVHTHGTRRLESEPLGTAATITG